VRKRILLSTVGAISAVAALAACGGYGSYGQGAGDGQDAEPAANAAPANDEGPEDKGQQDLSGKPAVKPAKVLKVTKLDGFSPIVTSATGRTVYRFDNDSPNPSQSTCTGACTKTWEPVPAGTGISVRGGGIDIKKLGSIEGPQGKQVTLKGWPLYYSKNDIKLGETSGHGTGGVWFAVNPNGGKAKKAGDDAPPSVPAQKDVQTLTVKTVDGFMSFVTSGTGRVMYRFDADSPNPPTSTCFDGCAKTWEPVLAGPKGFKVIGKGIKQSDIGTIERPEGTQLTLKGWPLYYFHKDKLLGEVSGYGTGNVWFPIAPNGKKALRCA
jgi:predicted lipoprotein with Yx(FWY)xxD motif